MLRTKYKLIIYWSEQDNQFIAEAPELPGCYAEGKTYEEAVKNIQVVMEEWIEMANELGREIPKAKEKFMYS